MNAILYSTLCLTSYETVVSKLPKVNNLMTRQAHVQRFKTIIGHSAKQSGGLQESRDCRMSALLPAGFHGWAAGKMVHFCRAGSQRANRSRPPLAEAEIRTCKDSISSSLGNSLT